MSIKANESPKILELNKDGIDLSALQKDNEPENVQQEVASVPEVQEQANILPEIQPEVIESYEDPVEKRKLIKEIQAYAMSRLAKYITHMDVRSATLEAKSIQELVDVKREVQYCVGVKSNGNFWWNGFVNGLSAVEYVGVAYTPLKVQGLQFALSQSEEAHDIVEEIALKHQNLAYVEPEVRLGLLVMQTALALHQVNLGREAANNFYSEQVPENVAEKYKNI